MVVIKFLYFLLQNLSIHLSKKPDHKLELHLSEHLIRMLLAWLGFGTMTSLALWASISFAPSPGQNEDASGSRAALQTYSDS